MPSHVPTKRLFDNKKMDEKNVAMLEHAVWLWEEFSCGRKAREEMGYKWEDLFQEITSALNRPLWHLFHPLQKVGSGEVDGSFVTFVIKENQSSFRLDDEPDHQKEVLQQIIRHSFGKKLKTELFY